MLSHAGSSMVNGPTESLTMRRRFDMENRAYAFITGLFMITLVSAAIAAWVWLSNRHVEHRPYVIVSLRTRSQD